MTVRQAIAAVTAALGLSMGSAPVSAQNVRAEVITVTPPTGWVLSVWQGGTIEVGEFTPSGQTGAAFVDLLGYSALPLTDDSPGTIEDLRVFETEYAPKECEVSAMQERQASAGWFGLARVCIGRRDLPSDLAEMEFAVTTTTEQAVYRVWRTRRVPFAQLAIEAGVPGLSPEDLDETKFTVMVNALAPRLETDLAQREVCDLSRPAECAAFPRSLPPEAEYRFDGKTYVIGAWAPGENRITRERFLEFFRATDDGTPSQVIALLGAGDFDWNDADAVERLLTMFAYGRAADGAVLGVTDPESLLSPTERGHIRAVVIQSLRRLIRAETLPSGIIIALPAE